MANVYIVGCYTKSNDIMEAALGYLVQGDNVSINFVPYAQSDSKREEIMQQYEKIKNSDFVILVPRDDNNYPDYVHYELAYAEAFGKHILEWPGIEDKFRRLKS